MQSLRLNNYLRKQIRKELMKDKFVAEREALNDRTAAAVAIPRERLNEKLGIQTKDAT